MARKKKNKPSLSAFLHFVGWFFLSSSFQNPFAGCETRATFWKKNVAAYALWHDGQDLRSCALTCSQIKLPFLRLTSEDTTCLRFIERHMIQAREKPRFYCFHCQFESNIPMGLLFWGTMIKILLCQVEGVMKTCCWPLRKLSSQVNPAEAHIIDERPYMRQPEAQKRTCAQAPPGTPWAGVLSHPIALEFASFDYIKRHSGYEDKKCISSASVNSGFFNKPHVWGRERLFPRDMIISMTSVLTGITTLLYAGGFGYQCLREGRVVQVRARVVGTGSRDRVDILGKRQRKEVGELSSLSKHAYHNQIKKGSAIDDEHLTAIDGSAVLWSKSRAGCT
ncbi:LOW QUALITY PROTEIN: hypothetical protein NC651_032115 [Populus alba x Populus x berolinensis]|nr:LOW QUALITY PROTEIN: hypothetical protein NC651_032115 [Populus alba x Populus x berolinensis]